MRIQNFILAAIGLLISMTITAQRPHTGCSHAMHGGALRMLWDDPGNSRSDTLDIVHTDIYLDLTKTNQNQISGACTHEMVVLMDGVDSLHFDLQNLTTDSVKQGNLSLNFQHIGTDLFIALSNVVNTNDNIEVTIYYHGSPAVDPSFGGFYTNATYAYNLGVGFNANPHNFGRAWFPCFDNFVERSTYTVRTLTNQGRKSYAGGMKTSEEIVGQDSTMTTWELDRTIPSYLASVAASNYTHVNWTFESVSGENIPIYLASLPSDTTDFKSSFENIIPWMESQEFYYGPYRWPRVGYVAVPFNGGAMEHATNIAYPLFAIDGSLDYETLMAHEIAHHWWGDLITCSTAEDMWLNEGWASFSEALFLEAIYGYDEYIDYVRDNHKSVLLTAHTLDGGRYPVSGVPHELVYGSHVYNKGALIAHSLRGYMGDEAFFEAIRNFMDHYSFQAVSSENLRDFFQEYTEQDLTAFFDNWVFAEGDAEFRVHHWTQNNNEINVAVSQYQHYNPELFQNIPLQFTATDWIGNQYDTTLVVTDASSEVSFSLPESFEVKSILLNKNDRLSLAILSETRVANATGLQNFAYAEAQLQVNNMGENDSLILHVENHFAPADVPNAIPFTDYILSNDRWWLIDGDFDNATINATFRYYGSPTSGQYYDPEFFPILQDLGLTENDLKIFYRPNSNSGWQIWESAEVQTQGSATNFSGRIIVSSIQKGQYCWGIQSGTVGFQPSTNSSIEPTVYRSNEMRLHMKNSKNGGAFQVFDLNGKAITSLMKFEGDQSIDIQSWASGTYLVKYSSKDIQKTFHITKP
jgi:aminopeptidase N